MKTQLLSLTIFIAFAQSATATLVTRTVNIPFVNNTINVDVDNDGLNEFYIDNYMEDGLPFHADGPPCEYNEYIPQVVILKSNSNASAGPHYGTISNDISNIPGISDMIEVPILFTGPGVISHLRLGHYREFTPVSGTCTPSVYTKDTYTGFLNDVNTTTNTYFAFNVRFQDGTYHYGYLEFDGYKIVKIVYDDVATGVTLTEANGSMNIESNEGTIRIFSDEAIEQVVISDLNGRTEEHKGATFHTNKKGWVILNISTASGLVERRRVFIQ